MGNLEIQARGAAARVDAVALGMNPAVVLTLFNMIIPMLTGCLTRNIEPDPSMAAITLRERYAKNPDKLRRSAARRIKFESDEPLTREQSLALADAAIAQGLSVDTQTALACVNEVDLHEGIP